MRYNSLEDRIIANTFLSDECYFDCSPCWIWMGNRDDDGYGRITIRSHGKHRKIRVIRLVLSVFRGIELAPKEQALHGCNNPPCCNPMHLRPGTNRTNQVQSYAQGRSALNKVNEARA